MANATLRGLEVDLFSNPYASSKKLPPAVRDFLVQAGAILSEAERSATETATLEKPADDTLPAALTPEQISLIEEHAINELTGSEASEEAWKDWLVKNSNRGAPAAVPNGQVNMPLAPPPAPSARLTPQKPEIRPPASKTETPAKSLEPVARRGLTQQQNAAAPTDNKPPKNTEAPKPLLVLPQELLFTRFLQSATEKMDPAYRDRLYRHALRILGPVNAGDYQYDRVRAYETFALAVEKLAEADSITSGLLMELNNLDVTDSGRMIRLNTDLENAAGDPKRISGILSSLRSAARLEKTPVAHSPRRPDKKDVTLAERVRQMPLQKPPEVFAPAPRQPVQPEVQEKKTASYYFSALRDAMRTLQQDRTEAATSYLMRVLDVDSADAVPKSDDRMRLAEDFLSLVKGGVVRGVFPDAFYKALGKIFVLSEAVEFQHAIRSSGGDKKRIMEVLGDYVDTDSLYETDEKPRQYTPPVIGQSTHAQQASAQPANKTGLIKTAEDMYKEDSGMAAVVNRAQAFADDMVAARNALVAEHTDDTPIRNFYSAMRVISGYGDDRGSVYRDVLRLIRSSPMVGRVLLGWIASEGSPSINEMDKELGKHTAVGSRTYNYR